MTLISNPETAWVVIVAIISFTIIYLNTKKV